MIIIRQEEATDRGAIFGVNEHAFERKAEALLVDQLRSTDSWIPELSLVAVVDGTIVGHILFTRIHIQTDSRTIPVLSLAPMAVLPEYQNRGIGSELVRKGIQRCRQLGHGIVIVIGHPAYYPRFGFTPARGKGLESSYPVPDEAFMVLELSAGALDGIHGIVEYPEVFNGV